MRFPTLSALLVSCVAATFAVAQTATAPGKPAPVKPAKAATSKQAAKPKPAAPRAAAAKAVGIDQPDETGLYNVSLMALGATAKASGVPVNKDWPANNTLVPGLGRSGVMMGVPLKGGRVDIRLIVPVDIKALELVALDYGGTLQPKAIDIFIDGKKVKSAQLEEKPGQPIRVPVEGKGQNVGILITEEHARRELPGGKLGPAYGGWSRIRVLTDTNVPEMLKAPEGFKVDVNAANLSPTIGSAAEGKIEVVGQPRDVKQHPNTLWDAEDIAHYKQMIATNKELQKQFEGLKRGSEDRLKKDVWVPPAKKDAAGNFVHASDQEQLNGKGIGAWHNQLGLDICNLGMTYALTGDERYAEYCKKMLLAYADQYPNYAVGSRPGFNHSPSKAFDQVLGDATWLPQLAKGYDLIYNSPSITADERKHIEDNLIKATARTIVGNHAMLEASTNWSAIGTGAVLIAGYATDDQDLINTAMWGIRGTKEKPTGGLFDRHFGPKAISEDGMWVEGAMGYQFMALEALIMDAEILWHHGIDMYRYRDGALKKLFDSPLRICYPDLTTPATHDSGRGTIIGYESFLYEYAYRRYKDPSYLLVLNQAGTHLTAQFQQFQVSILYDRESSEKSAPPEFKSVNFFSVGYGILRQTTARGTNSVLLEYGPAGSHGHPDKLTLDIFAFGDQLMPDPGLVWYENPLYRSWYHTTLAHPTMIVDEIDQVMTGANQVTYGPGDALGVQRAWTTTAYPGVTMDRSVFVTPDYVADIFGAFAKLPRKLDLAYHIRGELATDLALAPMKFPEPVENGYSELKNVRHVVTDKPYTAAFARKGNTARLVAAGGTSTDVIIGDGLLGTEHPPTILQRRTAATTIYGNAIDISGAKEPYVKSVTQEGSLDAGYGVLKIQTPKGTDVAFASFRPGTYKAAGIETDALQAFVTMNGSDITGMYLAGGTSLKVGNVSLQRTEAGLASIEKAETGAFVVSNLSPSEATVTLNMPVLKGMDAFAVDNKGQRTGPAEVQSTQNTGMVLTIKPLAKVEFAPKGVASVKDHRDGMLRKVQAEEAAAREKARQEAAARGAQREAGAKQTPAPANTIVTVAADAFSNQTDGTVKVNGTKRGAIGNSILGWDGLGHAIEWTFEVPAAGYYNLTLCYCSDFDKIQREIAVNGEVQEPLAVMNIPGTGGWSNNSDDWRLFTALDPITQKPLLIKLNAGKNKIRLTNANGRGANINYLAITSPEVTPTRENLSAKLPK